MKHFSHTSPPIRFWPFQLKVSFLLVCIGTLFSVSALAQVSVDLSDFNKKGTSTASVEGKILSISWPTGKSEKGRLAINLEEGQALFQNIQMSKGKTWTHCHRSQSGFYTY